MYLRVYNIVKKPFEMDVTLSLTKERSKPLPCLHCHMFGPNALRGPLKPHIQQNKAGQNVWI